MNLNDLEHLQCLSPGSMKSIRLNTYLFWHYILNNILVDDLMQQSPLRKVADNIKNEIYSYRV